MHPVLGVVGVQLHRPAGILQGIDTVAQTLMRQRREVVPAGIAGGHAVQHPAGFRVAAIGHKIAGGLHLRGVAAVVAGSALLLAVAVEVKTESKGVEALEPVKAEAAVILLAVALLLVAAITLLPIGAAAHLGTGLALGDGVISGLHFLEVLLGGGVVGVQVGMPALALGAVGFFDLFIAGSALDDQHLIRISHWIYFLTSHFVQPQCCTMLLVYRNSVQKSRQNRCHAPALSERLAFLQLYFSHTPEYRMLRRRSTSSTQGRRSKLWAHWASSNSKMSFMVSS